MLTTLAHTLSPDQVAHCRARLAEAGWVDGKVTAGVQSARTKNNLQLPEDSPIARELGALVLDASNAQPLGLFFASGADDSNHGFSVANPIQDVLSELAQTGHTDGLQIAGGAPHPITCSNYDFDAGPGPVMNLPRREEDVVIGADTWLGVNVVVVAGVTIGDGAIVAASSVVTRDVPPGTLVAGSPARVLRSRGERT